MSSASNLSPPTGKMTEVLVRRVAISSSEMRHTELPEVGPGQILFAVERFAITANNVTYAAMGDSMSYWDFFPVVRDDGPSDFGVVPVWGHARVVASRVDGLEIGERVYGYLPMASHLLVTPGGIRPGSFADTSFHRAHLAQVYNQYRRLAGDPAHGSGREDVRAVFEPLFLTSWLICAMFARECWYGAKTLVITSASSKTALALAHVVRAKSPEITRVGLTSAGNVDFVTSTGLYDKVLTYAEVATLRGSSAVAVDLAGSGVVLRSVHEALETGLHYSCLVGLTHWESRGGAGDMPGPKPVLFFAPAHVQTAIAEMGGTQFAEAVAQDWRAFAEEAVALVHIAPRDGLSAAAQAFTDLVEGRARPDVATIVHLT